MTVAIAAAVLAVSLLGLLIGPTLLAVTVCTTDEWQCRNKWDGGAAVFFAVVLLLPATFGTVWSAVYLLIPEAR